MLQIPLKAESFSSLSRIFRNEVHLKNDSIEDQQCMTTNTKYHLDM